MVHYEHSTDDWEYPGFSYLNEALMSAIIDGDEKRVGAELDLQKRNETTDDVGNHLMVRGFWLHQKSQLVALYGAMASMADEDEIRAAVLACAGELDEHFRKTFVSEDKNYRYGKLSGDTLFREAVRSSNDVARAIIQMNPDDLRSPKELLDHVAPQHYTIVNILEKAPGDAAIAYQSERTPVAETMTETIASAIAAIDTEMTENLTEVAHRSHL